MPDLNRILPDKTNIPRERTRFSSDTIYLEADYTEPNGNAFYVGFDGNTVGVFIATYTLRPVGFQVALKVNFPSGEQRFVSGQVEWTRELQPLHMETEPGIGVRFNHLDRDLRSLLTLHAPHIPCLFFDADDLKYPHHTTIQKTHLSRTSATERTDVVQSAAMNPADESADFSGLLRDISAYLDQRNHSRVRLDGATTTPIHDPSSIIEARAVADLNGFRQFQGGFSNEDSGPKAFVVTEILRPIGTRAMIRIELPEGHILNAEGRVRWTRKRNPLVPPQTAPPGMGIILDPLQEDQWRFASALTCARSNILRCEETRPTF